MHFKFNKNSKRFFILAFFVFITFGSSCRCISLPNWLLGTWESYYESNLNNWYSLIVMKDRIFLTKGFFNNTNSKQEFPGEKYKNHYVITSTDKGFYKLVFFKSTESLTIEFKLSKIESFQTPVLYFTKTEFNFSNIYPTINRIVLRKSFRK